MNDSEDSLVNLVLLWSLFLPEDSLVSIIRVNNSILGVKFVRCVYDHSLPRILHLNGSDLALKQ